jgi:PadR family transcriptional regulator PadR
MSPAKPRRPTSLTGKEEVILRLLVSGGPQYGLQLVSSSDGQLKRGTIYVTLGRMEDKGYIESEADPAAADHLVLPRRIYRPTGYGLQVLGAWAQMRQTLKWEVAR